LDDISLDYTAESAEYAEQLCTASNADFSALSANAVFENERGDADLRRDRRHWPTVHPPRRHGDGDHPRADKALAAARQPDKCLAKGMAVDFDGCAELWPGPMKTWRVDCHQVLDML